MPARPDLRQLETQAFETTLQRFSQRVDEEIFSVEGPDGDLSRIPPLMTEAARAGILADPRGGAPGHELGVWGSALGKEGAMTSLLALSILGESCAGFAAGLHAQGVGCLAARDCPNALEVERLAAVFSSAYGIPIRAQPADYPLSLIMEGGAPCLQGRGLFVLQPGGAQGYACFALDHRSSASNREWLCVWVHAEGMAFDVEEAGWQAGLRACPLVHLDFHTMSVEEHAIFLQGASARKRLGQVLAADWLGQSAIALGVARRSLRDSRLYTSQRYQGGCLIEEHASIQLLQGEAEYALGMMDAIVHRHASQAWEDLPEKTLLAWALQAKLAIGDHAQKVVTNCLQTLGGYGYMEDFRFEKRLRDLAVLTSLHGSPDQLRLLLNENPM